MRQADVNLQVVLRRWRKRVFGQDQELGTREEATGSKFTCRARASAPPYLDYSSRRASTGSIRIALRAGTSAASAEISNNAAGTLTKVAGSSD